MHLTAANSNNSAHRQVSLSFPRTLDLEADQTCMRVHVQLLVPRHVLAVRMYAKDL